jgi:hypothetical protein
MTIKIMYEAVDGFSKEATFTDLGDAQRYAQFWMGKYYDLSAAGNYAVCGDGVARIIVDGVDIEELFKEIY